MVSVRRVSCAQPVGDPDDQQVADLMAKAVINDLEAIEIQEQDGKLSVRISPGVVQSTG